METPWMGEYVWEENKCDGSAPECVPLPDEVVAMFRPSKCLLCGTVTSSTQSTFTHYESKGHFKKVAQYMREKYNVLGTLKSKEKFRTVRCDVCQIDLTSRVVLMQHYEGKPHLKNLKKKTPESTETEKKDSADAPVGEKDFDNPMDFVKDLPPPPPLPKLGIYFCSLCQIKTKLKGQMEIHNTGSRHLKNLSKLADGELKEFFLANGNCEPVEGDGLDSTPPSTPVTDNQVTNPFTPAATPPVAGYQYPQGMDPSMGMPMMPYPQMPYGQYPQYPMNYDYSTWNQGQGYAGQQPYGDYNASYGYNGPYPYPTQYNTNQYPNQHQYSNQQYPPNNQYPPNQQEYHSGPPPDPTNEPCPAAPGTTDYPITSYGKNSTPKSKTGSSSPKDPEVRVSEVPENFEMKPLAVCNFVKLLAQEAKLEQETNGSTAKKGSDSEVPDTEKVEQTRPADPSPEEEAHLPSGAKLNELTSKSGDTIDDNIGEVDESVENTDNNNPGIDDVGVAPSIEEVVENNDKPHGDFSFEDESCRTSIGERCDEKMEDSSNPIEKPRDETDKTAEIPSSDNLEQQSKESGKFIDFGFSDAKMDNESVDSSAGKASADAFKFTIGGKATMGKPKVNTFFKRSTEKMLKEAKEKKRLEQLKKLKDSGIETKEIDLSSKVKGSIDQISNTSDQTTAISAQTPRNIEVSGNSKEELVSKKSDGEISDDIGDQAAQSSGNVSDSLSALKASYLTRTSVSDNEDTGNNKDGVEKKISKDEKEGEKKKSNVKKFSASEKKKVSRTRNSSSEGSRKSRSRSRTRRRRSSKHQSSSWSPSSEDETRNEYQGRNNYGHENNYQNNYYNNSRNRNWRNNQGGRGYYNRGVLIRNYWDQQRFGGWDNRDDYYEEHKKPVEDTDEFGREKRRREDKKKEKREKKRKKERKSSPSAMSISSRSSSGSRSRSRKKRKSGKKSKKRAASSPGVKIKNTQTPENKELENVSQSAKQVPLTLAQKLKLESAKRASDAVLEDQHILNLDEIEPPQEIVSRREKRELPEASSNKEVEDRKGSVENPILPSELLEALVKEREKQEILKKMAMIKLKLQQKEKADKKKKKKKEKSKKKKKKRSSSTSSSSSSSSSSSVSSSSSSSTSSSHSESLAEKLLAKMKRDSKRPSSLLPDLAKVLPLLKKDSADENPKKRKKKKDKKQKKKKSKKSSKSEPSDSSLSAYLTSSGLYLCKCCSLTFASGDLFIEHCHSDKHKLVYKLFKEKSTR